MADDLAVLLGDEGDDVRLSAQCIDDPGFRGGFECGAVQGMHVWDVGGLFRSYLHGWTSIMVRVHRLTHAMRSPLAS